MAVFEAGIQLQEVTGPVSSDGECQYAVVGAANSKSGYSATRLCTTIVVTMENGHMAGVPWALAVFHDGHQEMFNLALMETVRLL